MEYFRQINLEDKSLFKSYEKLITSKSYEYSFVSLYLWKDLCNIEFSIIDNCLIIKKNEENSGIYFMMPYGYKKENLQILVEKLKNILNNENNSLYLFGDIEDNFIEDLKLYTTFNYNIIDDRNNYEYVYLTKDLINLSGKRYHSKRNHCNSFAKLYKYEITSIDSENKINDCIDLLKKWHNSKSITCKELSFEINEINNILYNIDNLDLKTIAVYVDNKLAGFSIGEVFKNTAIIHVERCDINYKGIYSFINREFLKKDFRNTIFVNREEDCGLNGLRISKTSYHPNQLLKKSLIAIL